MQEKARFSMAGRWNWAIAALLTAVLAFALGGFATQTSWADEPQGGEEQLAVQDDALDLTQGNFRFFNGETYIVGDGLYAPNPRSPYDTLTMGVDYGMKVVAPDGTESDATDEIAKVKPKESSAFTLDQIGTYTLTLYAKSDKCTGELNGKVTVLKSYFTVYVQDPDGVASVAKEYTYKKDFEALPQESDPVSAIYNGDSVATATSYITLDTILEDAGVTADTWRSGASIVYAAGSEQFTYDQLQQAKYYPQFNGKAYGDESVSVPFVLALKEFSSTIEKDKTAADAAAVNISKANASNSPRVYVGYIEGAKNDGHRLWSHETSITIVMAPRESQAITAKDATKTFGDKAFALGATAKTELSYKSSDDKVAKVDAKGNVSITGAGKAKITITAAQTNEYEQASKTITVTVNRAKQTPTVKAKAVNANAKKNTTIKKAKAFAVSGAKGTVKFAKVGKVGGKKITVASNGKVTVKKGLKKGTYKVKVKVTALGNSNYAKAAKTVTLKIKVK